MSAVIFCIYIYIYVMIYVMRPTRDAWQRYAFSGEHSIKEFALHRLIPWTSRWTSPPFFFPYVYFEVPILLILILEELAACEIAINVNRI